MQNPIFGKQQNKEFQSLGPRNQEKPTQKDHVLIRFLFVFYWQSGLPCLPGYGFLPAPSPDETPGQKPGQTPGQKSDQKPDQSPAKNIVKNMGARRYYTFDLVDM